MEHCSICGAPLSAEAIADGVCICKGCLVDRHQVEEREEAETW